MSCNQTRAARKQRGEEDAHWNFRSLTVPPTCMCVSICVSPARHHVAICVMHHYDVQRDLRARARRRRPRRTGVRSSQGRSRTQRQLSLWLQCAFALESARGRTPAPRPPLAEPSSEAGATRAARRFNKPSREARHRAPRDPPARGAWKEVRVVAAHQYRISARKGRSALAQGRRARFRLRRTWACRARLPQCAAAPRASTARALPPSKF